MVQYLSGKNSQFNHELIFFLPETLMHISLLYLVLKKESLPKKHHSPCSRGSRGSEVPATAGQGSRWQISSTSVAAVWRASWTTRWPSASQRRSWRAGTFWPEAGVTSATSAPSWLSCGLWGSSSATVSCSLSGQSGEKSFSQLWTVFLMPCCVSSCCAELLWQPPGSSCSSSWPPWWASYPADGECDSFSDHRPGDPHINTSSLSSWPSG